MTSTPHEELQPKNLRARVAIDLGAESCRLSLLRWIDGKPSIELVHRFPNAPFQTNGQIHWNLKAICAGLEEGLHTCASRAPEGVASIAVDGWAVDYVRVDESGRPLDDPFCYRDPRTVEAYDIVKARIGSEKLYELTGVQPLRINTIYQLVADGQRGVPANSQWTSVPEFILSWLGGRRVAEYTNATHTGLVDLRTGQWSDDVFRMLSLPIGAAPPIVPSGTILGSPRKDFASIPAFRNTLLIAPACHDTASAIATITADTDDCAYISSGTWSLVGALSRVPYTTEEALVAGFANLGAVGGRICFHKNVNGMWLFKQCLDDWEKRNFGWEAEKLIEMAEVLPKPSFCLDVDEAALMLPGDMPSRINAQLERRGLPTIPETCSSAPAVANLIFHSLASRYAQVIQDLKRITHKNVNRLFIVGGGSRNTLLNRLTQEASGIQVSRGAVESSTLGNFVVQLASLEGSCDPAIGVSADDVAEWARCLSANRETGPLMFQSR